MTNKEKEKIKCDMLIANYVNLKELSEGKSSFEQWCYTGDTPASLINIIGLEMKSNLWYVSNLRFNKSLDWSMTVLEKIQSEGYCWKIETEHHPISKYVCKIGGFIYAYGKTPQEAVYNAIVEFIKWKNSLPTKE